MESPGILAVANTAAPHLTASIRSAAAPRTNRAAGLWAAWWQAFLTRRARKQTVVALSELGNDVLRDIGVPESLLGEAEATRRLEENRRAFWLWS